MLCKSFVEADEAAVCCDQVSSKLLLEFHIVSSFGFYSNYNRVFLFFIFLQNTTGLLVRICILLSHDVKFLFLFLSLICVFCLFLTYLFIINFYVCMIFMIQLLFLLVFQSNLYSRLLLLHSDLK